MPDPTNTTDTVPAPSAAELAALAAYVRTLADRMGLKDWTFEVDLVVNTQDQYGIEPHGCGIDDPDATDKHATLLVEDKFFGRSPDVRRAVLMKELLVCHAGVLQEFVIGRIPDASFADNCRFDDEYRRYIAPIVKAWAPCLPLPLVGWMARAKDAGEVDHGTE